MSLEQYRAQIDALDKDLLSLFCKRMEVAKKIGQYKLENDIPILDSRREREVIKNRLAQVAEASLKPAAEEFLCAMMDISKKEQKKLQPEEVCIISPYEVVGFQGVEGAYSEQALEAYFGEDVCRVCMRYFEDVFEAVCDGRIKYGVLPIENSSTGAVAEVYDLLLKYNCFIVGEQLVRVDHCLVGLPDASEDDVETVFSHPQGLLQCSTYLTDMGFSLKQESNTAESAKKVAALGDRTCAAIASEHAAELYGLKVLARNISTATNTTRFIVISSVAQSDEQSNKISTAFTLKHESGTLYAAISHIAQQGLNLLKIESRPTKKNWEYCFYVDFEGNLEDDAVQLAITRIIPNCVEFRILGNYQKAE